jgi:Fe-S-cluster containining protein
MAIEEPEIPKEFECRRCGYCCKHYGPELSFYREDIDRWAANDLDWIFYYPFIDWKLQEFVAPNNGVYYVNTVKDARQLLAEKEREYEEDFDYRPEPFPWGGTLSYCPFLKWVGNKWGCLIHEHKTDTCREYLCYWDRVEAFFGTRSFVTFKQ